VTGVDQEQRTGVVAATGDAKTPSWEDVAARCGATWLERCAWRTAEQAVVPRTGASDDGEVRTGAYSAVPRERVAEATLDCGWNSCRFIATRCR
jgi:hypothetical protein